MTRDRAENLAFLGFTGSVLNRLDEIERAPGGSLLGCDITNPQPGLITAFQELGDGVSMVTKTIDTALRRCVVEDSEFLVSTVAISAEDDDLQLAKTCNSKSSSSSTRFKTASKFEYVRPFLQSFVACADGSIPQCIQGTPSIRRGCPPSAQHLESAIIKQGNAR